MHAFPFGNYQFRAYFFLKIGEVCDIHLHLCASVFSEILMVSEIHELWTITIYNIYSSDNKMIQLR